MRVFTAAPWRLAILVCLLGVTGAGLARADDALKRVQQSLRDQGFYYGPIDGSPGDETTQALRRYQIRNGLQVTGQLNDETRRSLDRNSPVAGGNAGAGSKASNGGRITGNAPASSVNGSTGSSGHPTGNGGTGTSRSTPPPLSTPAISPRSAAPRRAPTPAADDNDDQPAPPTYRSPGRPSADGGDDDYRAPVARVTVPGNIRPDLRARPDDRGGLEDRGGGIYTPPGGIAPSGRLTTLFANTPYEFAPPPVQIDVVRRAQAVLARSGFYDERVTGYPGASTTDAILDYQDVNHLRRTGRLDVGTLGTMRLLPGRQTLDPRQRDYERGNPGIVFPGRAVD